VPCAGGITTRRVRVENAGDGERDHAAGAVPGAPAGGEAACAPRARPGDDVRAARHAWGGQRNAVQAQGARGERQAGQLRKSFLQADGTMDWDAVIEAELVRRRKCYEEPPESLNVRVDGTFYDVDDPLLDLIDEVPWKYWVMRFHMPEAEQVNGRAAMIGFAASYLCDAIFHVGPVAQCDSFFGKLFMFATFAGVALLRRTEDVDKFKQLYEEATFYDSQWQATLKELGATK